MATIQHTVVIAHHSDYSDTAKVLYTHTHTHTHTHNNDRLESTALAGKQPSCS